MLKTVNKNETGKGDFDGRILEDSESESEDVFITRGVARDFFLPW